jgi:hypothetical protein
MKWNGIISNDLFDFGIKNGNFWTFKGMSLKSICSSFGDHEIDCL